MFSVRRIQERNKARLLSGPITFVKNLTGVIDSIEAVSYKFLINQIKSKGDREMAKVVARAHKKAYWTMMDILVNGGVDTGIALSETTHTKEGSPRVRYMENERKKIFKPLIKNILGRNVNVNPLNWEKYPQRAMAAADAFSQLMLQEAESYNYIKNDLLKKNPNLSQKEASKKAYEIAFSIDIADAIKQAAQEFKDRGIPLSANVSAGVAPMARFNRRVHEIIEQARSKEAIKAGQLYGNRYTYKAIDAGAMTPFIKLVLAFRSIGSSLSARLRSDAKKNNSKAMYQAANAVDAVWGLSFDQVLPFVKSVGNIVEKNLEFIPEYGLAKAGVYGAIAGVNKFKGNDSEYNFERAGEYAFRAAIGQLFLLAMMALADDDEDEKKAIYGAGSRDYRENKNREQQRPKNTIRIGGNNIPMDLFGSFALSLRNEARKLDAERYEDTKIQSALRFGQVVVSDLYFEKLSRSIDAANRALREDKSGKAESFATNEAAEFLSRTLLPFTALSRQAEQLRDPSKKVTPTFAEQFYKQSGVYLGWKNEKLAFDYRGRKVDVGAAFTSSADGFTKMMKDAPKIDEVDRLIFKYNPALTQMSITDDNILVVNEDYVYEPMGRVDFTEFSENSAKKFGEITQAWADTKPEEKVNAVASGISPDDVSMTANQYEEYYQKAQEELKTEDKAALDKRAKEIGIEEKRQGEIKKQIGVIHKLANDAAIEEYYLSKGMRVPFDKVGSLDKYKAGLEVLKKLKAK